MRYNEILDRIRQLERDVHQQRIQEQRDEADHTVVSSRGNDYYVVRRDWHCTCPSFRYQRGTDSRGYCKHIRKVIGEG